MLCNGRSSILIVGAHRRPVILYDQLGNGASSHCTGVPKEFWGIELFVDELENLLGALGVSEDFDLLGHSWGGMGPM